MLSSKELSKIQNLISNQSITFDQLISEFAKTFDSSAYFKICMTLEILIKDSQLNIFQEISSFYILYYLNKEKKAYSTFSSLLLKILKSCKMKEKKLILIDMMNDKINSKMKIFDYIQSIRNYNFDDNIEKEINNIINEGYTHEDNINDFYSIKPIVYEKKVENKSFKSNDISKYSLDQNNIKYIESNYMLYYPLYSKKIIFNGELKWIIPNLKHNFIWENNCYDKLRYLINQILDNSSLTKDEINFIILSIKKNPNIIKTINLTPTKMMELIEKDEYLSSEILMIICKTSLNE